VVVVDHELQVLVWNDKSQDLWGLRREEAVGRNFLNLDIGLPVEQLRQPIRAALQGEANVTEVEVDAVNRRGKAIRCFVTCTPLIGPAADRRGAILVIDDRGESEA
jgi:two-component system CheB/CheR fusion protein